MWIIKNFKYFFKVALRKKILFLSELHTNEDCKNLMKRINVLEAIHLSSKAWDSVTKETIKNCFLKGFSLDKNIEIDLTMNLELSNEMNINDLDIHINDEDELFHELILNESVEIENESEIIDTASTITVNEAMQALNVVETLFKENGCSPHLFKAFNEAENALVLMKCEQSNVQSTMSKFIEKIQ